MKTEKALNDLIAKNRIIQSDCDGISQKVDFGKNKCDDITEKLANLVNPEMIGDLNVKYTDKNNLIDDCIKLQEKLIGDVEKQQGQLLK